MYFFFFQAEDGIRDIGVTGVQTCALPISDRLAALYEPGLKRNDRMGAHGLRTPEMLSGGGGLIGSAADYHRFTARSEERRVGKSVDLGGRRIIKKKTLHSHCSSHPTSLVI